ncbi:Arylsulfatase precursor [Maioricimonas rarisocia]|uniref:Arylsulfatase n=1 Tax=Maioricimonas rarisocia TaxID=2528026 RepID=A0A517Z777_9PLAN|nr:sulfatase [Maioricimonas rarisocia]QDU38299.1 Arylsulfatase precursor [Maioricimonas rarisocia]
MRSRSVLSVAVWGCLLVLCAVGQTHAADRPPNVVIIFADDLGYGDLECYGHPEFRTPALNRMAAEGVRLTQCYVPTPYCAPSRGTILTGRYPWRHGVWRNPTPDAGINDVGLPASELTIAELLREEGYATSCIGKWHLGHRPEFYPTRQGFDEYFGILYSNDMRPVELIENGRQVEYPVVQATLTQRYTTRAIDFIRRNRERPFFLYLPHAMPHKPLAASEEFYKQTGTGLYGDVIAELDWSVGQVLSELKTQGLDEQTLVIFTSDNGPWFGGSTGGLRGMKAVTWEGGLRVPAIIRWPGRIPEDVVLDQPCGTIDVLPTVLAAVGLPLPDDRTIDGRSLLPLLEQGDEQSERALFGMRGNQLACVRKGRYKLHVNTPKRTRYMEDASEWIDPRGPDGTTILAPAEQYRPDQYPGLLTGDAPVDMMLFDLEADPGEQHDIAGRFPEVVAELKAEYDAMLEQFPPDIRQPRRK